ncbi:hypothetical protein [Fulvivirga sp.]|uniref:hypothetical protein n=1 Tax=Fulvivirga sp. TaxID=1931237 RepID=UPI0032ED01A1
MKQYYIVIFFLLTLAFGCNDEEGAGPGESDTFVKLYGSRYGEDAQDLLVESDGRMLVLSSTEIEIDDDTYYKVIVRQIDALGNLLWESTFPSSEIENTLPNYTGSSIIKHLDGYLIIGSSINTDSETSESETNMLLLKIDQSGSMIATSEFSLDDGSTELNGVDAVVNSVGELKVTALLNSDTQNLWVGTFDDNLNNIPECSFSFSSAGSGTSLIQGAFVEENNDIVYSISTFVNKGNSRLVRVPSCQPTQITGPLISTEANTASYDINQLSTSLNGYAMVGTTDVNGDNDIFLARVDEFGVLQDSIPIVFGGADLDGDEEGFGIYQTADGGFLITGSSESNTEGGSDIILIKTDFRGNELWSRFYGDQNDEQASEIGQAPDGGYLILGDTEFGGINTLILIKTDRQGNVN